MTIIDATLGVVKADVGIKDGKIGGIGKAGNPGTMDGVTPGLGVGPATDAISGEQLILTAAGIDSHVHYISPQQATRRSQQRRHDLLRRRHRPHRRHQRHDHHLGPWNLEMMLRAVEGCRSTSGSWARATRPATAPLVEQIVAGAAGFKIHEDWGTTPGGHPRRAHGRRRDATSRCAIHTDTLNEAGFVEDTIAAFEGRTIHTYHSEGAGGGHAPGHPQGRGELNVLPSSTNPTLPYGINTQAELFDMIMVCHNLNPTIPSDVAFAESRVRAETIAAENVLHDMGVISMFSSDSQAMGRVGENWLRAIQTADAMKTGARQAARGRAGQRQLPRPALRRQGHDQPGDHPRHHPRAGSIERRQDGRPGAVGAGVLRRQAQAGHQGRPDQLGGHGRPERVAADAAAGLLPADVRRVRHGAAADLRHLRLAAPRTTPGISEQLGLQRQVMPVHGTRTITKRDMVRNARTPKIEVNPETFAVTVDGVHATVDAARRRSALNQLYFFS